MNATIELFGEQVELRPERTLFWPSRRTLLIADPHFGKTETFRAAALPVPGRSDTALSRLTKALTETRAERLVVLGDFWHARTGRSASVLDELTEWRSSHRELQVELVRGNHDRAGPPPASWAEAWHSDTLVEAPFVFAHVPNPSPDGYVLAGHLHPGVVLTGRGRQRLRLPCFWFGDGVGVLPAFGEFTGLAIVRPQASDRLFAVAGEEVIDVSHHLV